MDNFRGYIPSSMRRIKLSCLHRKKHARTNFREEILRFGSNLIELFMRLCAYSRFSNFSGTCYSTAQLQID